MDTAHLFLIVVSVAVIANGRWMQWRDGTIRREWRRDEKLQGVISINIHPLKELCVDRPLFRFKFSTLREIRLHVLVLEDDEIVLRREVHPALFIGRW